MSGRERRSPAARGRRDFLQLGLGGGLTALLGARLPARAEPSAGYPASAVHAGHPLEFRLDSEYRPDLSDASGRALVRATLSFLEAEHPDGLTVTFWELAPRDMPYMPRHLELIVEHLFRAVRDHLSLRPVDPLMVLALLYNESRFHPKVVSKAGAVGMAQFMPETALEYGLSPVARLDLWQRYRDARAAHAAERGRRIREFRARHGGIAFDAESAIGRSLETQDVAVLADYRAIVEAEDPGEAVRAEYVSAVESDLAPHRFFWDGREALGRIDGRASYDAVTRTVLYLARTLDQLQGMSSSAMASYNAGPASVRVSDPRSILHRFGDIPPYPETVRYVQRFMVVYAAIKYRLFRDSGGAVG